MTPPAVLTDLHGNRYATVHVEELDDWARLIGQLEDWLLHAHDSTITDWAAFSGLSGMPIDDVIDMLGDWSVRMHKLAQGQRP